MPSFLVNTSGKLPVFARPQQFWGADCPRKHESSRRISCADPAPQHAWSRRLLSAQTHKDQWHPGVSPDWPQLSWAGQKGMEKGGAWPGLQTMVGTGHWALILEHPPRATASSSCHSSSISGASSFLTPSFLEHPVSQHHHFWSILLPWPIISGASSVSASTFLEHPLDSSSASLQL